MALTRDEILNCDDVQIVKVSVPEWGDHVYVKSMTGTERDAWEATRIGGTAAKPTLQFNNERADLASRTLCDKGGTLLFTAAEAVALGKKNAAALDRVYAVAQRLSKISADDIEELAGNSDGAPSAECGSD
jgi:hypothetical protein